MKDLLKKIIFAFLGFALISYLTLFAFNTFLKWQKSQYFEKKIKLLPETPEEVKADKEQDRRLKDKQIESLSGFQPANKGSVMEWDERSYMGIEGLSSRLEGNVEAGEGKLIFEEETQQFFQKILKDIDDFLNNNGILGPDQHGDNYTEFLMRDNCILYGAPGTGKTEFVRELNRALIEKYSGRQEVIADPDDPRNGLISPEENDKRPIIPIFEINGERLQTGGATTKDINTHEKLAQIIKHLKKEFFGDEKSEKPYIVFIDEADQAKNTTTYRAGACLEEWKNFLSTASDSQGLANEVNPAQDRNSIIIAATNNFEDIDPAVVRRGRLGEKFNFTWNPLTLKKYGIKEGINWPKVSNQDHPCWKFEENKHYQELFKLANKFGFAKFKNRFVDHANKIIQSWQSLSHETRQSKEENELGLEDKYWCQTEQKEVELETANQKNDRIQAAVKRATQNLSGDQNAYDRAAKQTREQVIKIKQGKCGHQVEPICNWLLHYIYTFHLYNDKEDLASFTSAEQIKRYEFSDNQLLRERIRELGTEIYNAHVALENGVGEGLHKLQGILEQIKEEINAVEIQNLKNAVDNLHHHLNQAQTRMGSLQIQIDNAFSQLANAGSGGGGGSSSSTTYNPQVSQIRSQLLNLINNINQEMNDLQQQLQSLINLSGGTTSTVQGQIRTLQYGYSSLVNKVNRLVNYVNNI